MTDVVEYYSDTGLDYRTWSRNFNMHFGYWRWGLNPLARETMLEEMNAQVAERLELPGSVESVYDLGCGLGASMRFIAARHPSVRVTGVTLVPWQVEQARRLNADFGDRLELLQADYLAVPRPDGAAEAAYALESCCHAPGEDKAGFLRELHRLLRPGGRFVIGDGFTLRSSHSALLSRLVDWACEGWALPSFPCLPRFLERLDGFEDVRVEDISWNIAPSVMHSPVLVVGFLLARLARGEKLNRVRLNHLRSCFVSLAIGAHRRDFGYCLISGRKASSSESNASVSRTRAAASV